MKNLLTLALAASMILAMSVNAFALGNYVLSTDEVRHRRGRADCR